MDCQVVSSCLAAFQDGFLVEAERRRVEHHLAACPECAHHLDELRQVSGAVRALPRLPAPAALKTTLRIDASRAAERRRRYQDFGVWLGWAWGTFTLKIDNLMRPLALPFAGGLSSAMLLFLMVLGSFHGIVLVHADDVPTVLYTGASIKGTLAVPTNPDEIVVDVLVNEAGQGVDYRIPPGFTTLQSAAARRQVEAALLFLRFEPATTFGQPTSGWVRVSFHRSYIDVRG